MAGLTDQASGARTTGGEAIERAHQAWQESMLKQLDVLRQEIRVTQPGRVAANCGATLAEQQLHLEYWGQALVITWPELKASKLSDGSQCSVYDEGMLLYYLRQADGTPMADHWIGYRELPGGSFYSQAFQGYSGDRLARAYGENPESYIHAAGTLDGMPLPGLPGVAFAYQPLPRIRLASILYPGDEEFAARASVLFDAASSHYMTTDGLALLGAGLVGRLLHNTSS
ncbi:MAG TPA: DUF3786 domain-containing protein [Anaerolineales bacterium]|nr:DUF3786 domain-containing protein [Anaerolineales bacterium]